MSIKRYGLIFDDGTTAATIELKAYRLNPSAGLGRAQHMKNAARMLFPERLEDGRIGYIWNEWTDRRIEGWCEIGTDGRDQYQTWWGPSAVGKTTDAALILLLHWLSAPRETMINVVSTSMKAMKLRIFGEIARLHSLHGDMLPGDLKLSVPCIMLGEENSRAGIYGHAVEEGKIEQAINKMIGMHNEFNVLLIDEMQGSQLAAAKAFTNLAVGREAKFLGMGNPQSRLDPLGIYSEPEGGWDSINTSMLEWKTKWGKTLFFNGLLSPGIKDPERYFFLLKQRDIDSARRTDGENSMAFWSQRIGFMPPEGTLNTVMSETFIQKFNMTRKATWSYSTKIAFGLDPAYSAGGDRCVLYPILYGLFSNDVFGIEFQPPIRIDLARTGDKLMAFHIAEEVQRICSEMGGRPENIAMDCTGVQGAIADVIENTWGRGILRIQFGGKASDRFIDTSRRFKGIERYKNRVTELWHSVKLFGQAGQIRGMDMEAANEFSQRMLADCNTPVRVESKIDMKGRTGKSPDYADAAACAIAYVIEREGVLPGAGEALPELDVSKDQLFKNYDIDGDERNYLTSAL